jgi:hypothetical protein
MKVYRIVFILIIIFQVIEMMAQDELRNQPAPLTISSDYKNIRIDQYLDSLHLQYDLHFAYDPSSLPFDSLIDVRYKAQTLTFILNDIFKNYQPNIEISAKQVIISPAYRNLAVNNYITIQGVIVSSENNKPLPMVNISLKGKAIGTTTNLEGEYKFLIPRKYGSEYIYFSSIGYQTEDLLLPLQDSILNLSLKPLTINIEEVKVSYLKAADIITRVRENIQKNYARSPQLLTAFFRESIKQDGKFIEVSEAIIDIYKSAYFVSEDMEKVRFVKGRKSVTEPNIAMARLKLAGGPSLFASMDIAKHRNFISKDIDPTYVYHYLGKTIEFDRVVYRVGFRPISEHQDMIYYKGELHIDTESFAILSADFEMTKKTLRLSDRYLIKKNAKKITSTPVFTQYHVDYRPYGDRWLLNSVRGEVKIKMLDRRHKKKRSLYHIKAELLITNATNGKGQRIRYAESFKPNYILADKITYYDEYFWRDYNVINPERNLKDVFKTTAVEINVVPVLEKTRP